LLNTIFVVGLIVERTWEYLQLAIGEHLLSKNIKVFGAVAFSMAAVITLRLDLLFAIDLLEEVTWPGIILTGLVLSLGSHVLHDIIGIVQGLSSSVGPSIAARLGRL